MIGRAYSFFNTLDLLWLEELQMNAVEFLRRDDLMDLLIFDDF